MPWEAFVSIFTWIQACSTAAAFAKAQDDGTFAASSLAGRRAKNVGSARSRALAKLEDGVVSAAGGGGATDERAEGADVTKASLRACFEKFDVSGDGKLSASELRAILTRGGGASALSEADAQELIDEMDTDGDGMLSMNEFISGWAHFETSARK